MVTVMLTSKIKIIAGMLVVAWAIMGGLSVGTGRSCWTWLLEISAAEPKPTAEPADERASDTTKADDTEPTTGERVTADRAAMRGTWELSETVIERKGDNVLPARVEKVTFVVTDIGIIRVGDDGFAEDQWTFTLDPSKNPKAIDLSNPKYGTWRGIYHVEAGTLKICFTDGERPGQFPAKPETYWTLSRKSSMAAQVPQRFANAPGCFWIVEPTDPRNVGGLGVESFYEIDPAGAAVLTLAFGIPEKRSLSDFRPVFLDAAGDRFLPDIQQARSSSRRGVPGVTLRRWRMDPKILRAAKVVRIGIEAITDESRRIAADEAQQKALKAGVEVLAWPEVGRVYPFTLTTVDGQKLRSADMKGKVVVIDCWASWCEPCIALVPDLKRCYDKWHQDGLVIIGVSLDKDVETIQKVCKSHGVSWPQVLAPADDGTRQLWEMASGISGIPRVLVIDGDGVLRTEDTGKLEEEIARLLAASNRAPKSPAKR